MRFNRDGRVVDIPSAKLQELIELFVGIINTDLEVEHVWLFGGLVNEPDKVHGDIDILIEVDRFPEEIDVQFMAFDWGDALEKEPNLGLIDCFLFNGKKVATFSHDLPYLQVFGISETPKFGGLDDDDTSIYIGEKVELFPSGD